MGDNSVGEDRASPEKLAELDENFRIGWFLHDVSRMRRTLFDQRLKPLGITRSQWWVLAQLSHGGSDASHPGLLLTDLSRMLEVGKVTVGRLVDRLEASGFVERSAVPGDRRAKLIRITRAGYDLLGRMLPVREAVNADTMRGVDLADVAAAERVLARMKSNLREELERGDRAKMR